MFHNCFGTLLKDGSEYVGEWQDGRPNGQGTHSGVNGDKYVGEWRDGKHQGQGMLIKHFVTTDVGYVRESITG